MKLFPLLVAIQIVVAAASQPALAYFKDGNDLLSDCSENNESRVSKSICLGFVVGVNDAAELLEIGTKRICPPTGARAGQMQDIVVAYIKGNPKTRHYPAVILAATALQEAFPCQ